MSEEMDLVGLVVRLYPTPEQEQIIQQNIGNARFAWNNIFDAQNQMEALFQGTKYVPRPNYITFNRYLNILKETYPFLKKSESSSLQQVCRDLGKAYKKIERKREWENQDSKAKRIPKMAAEYNKTTKISKYTIVL